MYCEGTGNHVGSDWKKERKCPKSIAEENKSEHAIAVQALEKHAMGKIPVQSASTAAERVLTNGSTKIPVLEALPQIQTR
jgi:hypothetical protein